MAQIRVDVAGDNITITETGRAVIPTIDINRLLTQFKTLCGAAKVSIDGMGSFEELNQNINRADSIKDGTSSDNDLLGELFPQQPNWSLADLKNIIGGLKTYCIENNLIQRFTFTRTKARDNDTTRNWGLGPEFHIGYDAGLGLDTLFPGIDYRTILIETFGKYIDPSTGGRDAGGVFPPNRTELLLTEALFAKFGYLGNAACSLSATNIRRDQYDYEMFLANKPIPKNTETNRADDRNIKPYFGGNAEKSVVLQKSGQEDLKKQVIVGKGLGDKLQVIILWIRSRLQGNTGIATCDEVVALLCIILQLTFFLTSTSRDQDNVKIDEVLFYNPGGQNVDVALERYGQEYFIVLKSYDDMIKLIRLLLNDKSIPVIASGGGIEELKIEDDFYVKMLADLDDISNWIKATYNIVNFLDEATSAQIYGEMSHLKKLTARQIFKLNRMKTICQFVRTAKTYTCDDHILHYPFDKPNFKLDAFSDISKQTFYDLFDKNYRRRGGAAKLRGGMPSKAAGGPPEIIPNPEFQINKSNIKYKQSNFVYMSEIIAYIKPYDPIAFENNMAATTMATTMATTNQTLQNCSTDGQFDANAALRIKLYKLYNTTWINADATITFWEVLNECMEVFVYDPRYQTTRLKELINTFNMHLYITEPDTMDMSSHTDSSEETAISNESWYLGLGWEPNKVAELELKYESSSNDSNSDEAAEEGSDEESRARSDATSEANRSVPIIGNTPVKTEKNPNIPEVTPLKKGGSRRSKNFTQDHKYRNTKRSKKHTTRRKKTAKQSSKTRRSTKRKRNKKRRNTTRKN